MHSWLGRRDFPHRSSSPLVIVAVIAYGEGWPLLKTKIDEFGSSGGSTAAIGSVACAVQADRANLAWGAGLGRFTNPPVDGVAWDSFRLQVEDQVRDARTACGCPDGSCAKAREALADLDGLLRSFDSSVRSGAPPGLDLVQRQSAIDSKIEQASSMAKAGD